MKPRFTKAVKNTQVQWKQTVLFSGKHYDKYFLCKRKPNCETISVAFPSLGNILQLLLMLSFWQANVIFKYHRRNAESEFTQEDEV